MTEPYQYEPLDSKRFRLIKLWPAYLSRSPLRFDLESMSIEDAPLYVALSYTWDGQALEQPVWCSGKRLFLTENARAALRSLRKTRRAVYVWVDAICINQTSLEEKSAQVAMMADIYQKADWVAIWLGDLGDGAQAAHRIIWGGWWSALAEADHYKRKKRTWLRHLLIPSTYFGYSLNKPEC